MFAKMKQNFFLFYFEKSIRIRMMFYKVDSKQTCSSNNWMQSKSFFFDNRKMVRAHDDVVNLELCIE